MNNNKLIDINTCVGLRRYTGLTQKEFAERFKIPIARVKAWEQKGLGHREPKSWIIALLWRIIQLEEKLGKQQKSHH